MGDKMVKVSIIVPVYNVEKYIVKCISSIVNQKLKDIEIIVVNDGTKDNSIKLIEENFDDNRIKIFNKENGGAASAKNYGIKKAKGDFIFFVDGDDFIDECLYEMYNTATIEKTDLVICDYYKYFENETKQHVPIIPFYEKNNKKCSVISMPGPVCKLIKREIIIDNNITFLENHCFEDNAIMPYLCALCNKFSYITKPYYYYLQREGSALNKKNYSKSWEDIFSSLDNLYKRFNESNIINEYYQELEYIYIEYLLHAANLKFIDHKEGIHNIRKVSKIIKQKFPNWRKNYYYKKTNLKYKVMVNLFYYNLINLIKLLRRS